MAIPVLKIIISWVVIKVKELEIGNKHLKWIEVGSKRESSHKIAHQTCKRRSSVGKQKQGY